jgi:acetoin utilization deacetylase AcuC-like enzyme
LSFDGLIERDRRVFEFLRGHGVPVAVSMAGGYGSDIETTVAVHLNTVADAARSAAEWQLAAARRPLQSMKQSAA